MSKIENEWATKFEGTRVAKSATNLRYGTILFRASTCYTFEEIEKTRFDVFKFLWMSHVHFDYTKGERPQTARGRDPKQVATYAPYVICWVKDLRDNSEYYESVSLVSPSVARKKRLATELAFTTIAGAYSHAQSLLQGRIELLHQEELKIKSLIHDVALDAAAYTSPLRDGQTLPDL